MGGFYPRSKKVWPDWLSTQRLGESEWRSNSVSLWLREAHYFVFRAVAGWWDDTQSKYGSANIGLGKRHSTRRRFRDGLPGPAVLDLWPLFVLLLPTLLASVVVGEWLAATSRPGAK